MILSGRKTETRRLWPKGRRAVPGSLHWATTNLYDKSARFARLRILDVFQMQRLGNVQNMTAWVEGYDSREEFLDAFAHINGQEDIRHTDEFLNQSVWVVRFEVVAERYRDD